MGHILHFANGTFAPRRLRPLPRRQNLFRSRSRSCLLQLELKKHFFPFPTHPTILFYPLLRPVPPPPSLPPLPLFPTFLRFPSIPLRTVSLPPPTHLNYHYFFFLPPAIRSGSSSNGQCLYLGPGSMPFKEKKKKKKFLPKKKKKKKKKS